MTDKKSSENRRKLLKSIAAGSGAIVAGKSLPESWSRPVVDSVMIPAHAQTSPCAYTLTFILFDEQGAPVRHNEGSGRQGGRNQQGWSRLLDCPLDRRSPRSCP